MQLPQLQPICLQHLQQATCCCSTRSSQPAAAAAKVARQIFHKHNRAPSILMILMDKSAQNDGRKTCWEHPGQDVGQRQRHRQTEYEGGGEGGRRTGGSADCADLAVSGMCCQAPLAFCILRSFEPPLSLFLVQQCWGARPFKMQQVSPLTETRRNKYMYVYTDIYFQLKGERRSRGVWARRGEGALATTI